MLYLVISVTRYLNPHSSWAASWQPRNWSVFFSELRASHPSLGFCSTWTHLDRIFKALWKKTHSFLPLYVIPQSFIPLKDGNTIFLGPLSVTYMHLMKYLMQRNWTRCETLIWGAWKSLGLQSSAGIKSIQRSLRKKKSSKKAVRYFSLCLSWGMCWTLAMTGPGSLSSPLLSSSIHQQCKSYRITLGEVSCSSGVHWRLGHVPMLLCPIPMLLGHLHPGEDPNPDLLTMGNSSLRSSHMYICHMLTHTYFWQMEFLLGILSA